jgi:guanine deaminase
MDFIRRTIDLALANVEQGGRPFACLIVKDGAVLAEGIEVYRRWRELNG